MKRKGFTLVELIVVMAIITVLALLSQPRYKEHSEEAELTRLKVNIKEIETANQQYYMRYNDWPRLSDIPYTSEELVTYAKGIFDKTGEEVTLEEGNYYDIDYTKIDNYLKAPEGKENYILRNPVGSVYYLRDLTIEGLEVIGSGATPPREPGQLVMDGNGSTTINEIEKLVVGDTLTFNYTNNANLNWTVSQSGLYKIEVLGAGAGGKGARVEGEIVLTKGDILNLKIHQRSNGGGTGGDAYRMVGSTKYQHPSNYGGSGSGGSILQLNSEIVLASAGAGGNGGLGGNGSGGIGGNGNNLNTFAPGGNGIRGRKEGKLISTAGLSGSGISLGGSGSSPGGTSCGNYNNSRTSSGGNGPTLYDGGGGGIPTNCQPIVSYGPSGGGGAGGKSFVDEIKITNAVVTAGFNSGNGKVTLELIEKHR